MRILPCPHLAVESTHPSIILASALRSGGYADSEVIVIGGGIAGTSAAFHLAEYGRSITSSENPKRGSERLLIEHASQWLCE